MTFQGPIIHALSLSSKSAELLNEHHVKGLFYQRHQREDCLDQYKKQWVHNQVLITELESINQLAKRHHTTATLLKGAHLLFDLYTDLGSRFLSDIDLLIPSQDSNRWELILQELGFENISQKSFYGNHFKQEWCKKIGEIEVNVELHTKLFFHLKKTNWLISPTHFSNLFVLNHEDLFMHLCGHLAFQHTFLKLYWLFDIYFYYQHYSDEIDWTQLKIKSEKQGLRRSVEMCLWILKEHFALTLKEEVIFLFELNKKKWWHKKLTIDFLLSPLNRKKNYFLIKHATKDRLTTALYYDLAWLYHYKLRKLWRK